MSKHEINLDDYVPGKDCKCAAYGQSECECPDADWTPKEVYVLRAKVETLEARNKELESQQGETMMLGGANIALNKRIDELEARNKGLCLELGDAEGRNFNKSKGIIELEARNKELEEKNLRLLEQLYTDKGLSEISELESKLEAAEKDNKTYREFVYKIETHYLPRITALEQKLERYRLALEPFAKCGRELKEAMIKGGGTSKTCGLEKYLAAAETLADKEGV